MNEAAVTPEIETLIRSGAPVVIGVSGGIDSQAAALAAIACLNRFGHAGPRLLIHSDLGSVEWAQSLPTCERLARHLGVELVVARRKAGDLMDRWESRWASSVERYTNLSTVTLVPPWSTPSMRFCTSELKTHVITAELRRRFNGQTVINVTGVRRDESKSRSTRPVANLSSDGSFWDWRPIADWTKPEAFACVAAAGLQAHVAYTEFMMSRVSCRYCIMSSEADLRMATTDEAGHYIYRRQVDLEIDSSFAFQSTRWLADVSPHLLSSEKVAAVAFSKARAVTRKAAESRIADDMLYVKGWPTRMLTDDEADLLADVRRTVSGLYGFKSKYLDRASIHGRYAELMALNAERQARAA